MSVDLNTGEIQSPSLGPLAIALTKAQMAFPTVTRSKTVRVATKTGGSYTFSYAPLDTILDAVRKPLADNGLAIAQLIDRDSLVTMLMHSSGASIEGRAQLPPFTDVQGYGSAVTYLRRYAIQALLGIAAEEDDDGNHATGNTATPANRPAQAPRTPSAPVLPVSASPEPAGELTDFEWQELIGDSPPARPTSIASGPGLNSRDFFDRTKEAGLENADITRAAKRMFGQSKWKVTELSDEERALLWAELEPAVA